MTRSKIFQEIVDSTPESTKVEVRIYSKLVVSKISVEKGAEVMKLLKEYKAAAIKEAFADFLKWGYENHFEDTPENIERLKKEDRGLIDQFLTDYLNKKQ